jgi:16S rRNA (guanine966-N2)-methyltransferase
MRVIAGSAKGRRLQAPRTRDTRPLTDRVKEALFSSLGDQVEEAVVLDLFAGSGSFGIEALSRGAGRAVLVERGAQALAALRANLALVGFTNVEVIAQSVADYLAGADQVFDLIFCDPPWSLPTEEVEGLIGRLGARATEGAVLVVNRRSSDPEPRPSPPWRLVTTRRYGDGKIYRYVKEQD